MASGVEYILQRGGQIIRRRTEEVDLQVTDHIISQLTSTQKMQVRDCFMLEDKPVTLTVYPSLNNYYSLTLDSIILNTSFRVVGKTLTPVFSANDNIMSLPWPAQENMVIRLTIATAQDPTTWKHQLQNVYLFAFDINTKQCYKLPIANLYDDGRLCHGQPRKSFRTGADCVLDTWRLFGQSRWNGDLWKNAEQSQQMFSYTVTPDGFTPNKVEKWQQLCYVIGTPISEISL